jgi:hypothetical protein
MLDVTYMLKPEEQIGAFAAFRFAGGRFCRTAALAPLICCAVRRLEVVKWSATDRGRQVLRQLRENAPELKELDLRGATPVTVCFLRHGLLA